MDKNVREAAERLRKFHDDYDYTYWDGNKSPFCPHKDGVKVARAYLAEHPSDDEEPITEDFITSVGGEWKPHDNHQWLGPMWFGYFGLGAYVGVVDVNGGFEVKTRGQLRLLCRALGIQLSDSDTRKG